MEKNFSNSSDADSMSKIVFGDPVLCAQFLRGYVNIPLLKNVQPEDIEDVTTRFVHMFTEERDSDIINKIHIKNNDLPFYIVSLIEHKSKVDYNVVMQILRYMVFIWEDYEKEMEKKHRGISHTKTFRYPPILPIIFYNGGNNWTAPTRLKERILLSDVLTEYIPDFNCILVQLNDFSNEELMKHKNELSIIFMINKLKKVADFAGLKTDVDPVYYKDIVSHSPEYLLDIMAQIIEILLLNINVPTKEAAEFSSQVKERKMAKFFAMLEEYDVQAVRKQAREEARQEITEEVRQEVTEAVRQKVTEEVRQKVTEEVRQEMRQETVRDMIETLRELHTPTEIILEQINKRYPDEVNFAQNLLSAQ